MSGLSDWRSGLGHAFADAVADQLSALTPKWHRTIDPRYTAETVLRGVGVVKPERMPYAVQKAVVTWCRGMQEEARQVSGDPLRKVGGG